MTVMLPGMLMLSSAEQPENAYSPSVVSSAGSVMEASDSQLRKVYLPMVRNVEGSSTAANDVQPCNTPFPLSLSSKAVTPSGMTRLCSDEQP